MHPKCASIRFQWGSRAPKCPPRSPCRYHRGTSQTYRAGKAVSQPWVGATPRCWRGSSGTTRRHARIIPLLGLRSAVMLIRVLCQSCETMRSPGTGEALAARQRLHVNRGKNSRTCRDYIKLTVTGLRIVILQLFEACRRCRTKTGELRVDLGRLKVLEHSLVHWENLRQSRCA
jgi:hypothetical protein